LTSFHIWDFADEQIERTSEFQAEVVFLRSKQIVVDAPPINPHEFAETVLGGPTDSKRLYAQLMHAHASRHDTDEERTEGTIAVLRDGLTRWLTTKVLNPDGSDVVPICELDLPQALLGGSEPRMKSDLVEVTLQGLPTPDESCSWEDIISFKAELADKRWAFRRFLHTLATKKQSQAEIRDDIEWSLNEYSKAMEIHHIKASQSFVDVFVISPLEIIEDLLEFNWSKLAKGVLSVKKRQVELLEAEMKAPGRECAYVFEARKRFQAE
jgi:hypothetical protein